MAEQRPTSGPYKAPRGTQDVLPADQPYCDAIRRTAGPLAARYGYRRIGTPVSEALGLTGLLLKINSIGDRNCRPAYLEKLRDYYRPHLEQVCHDCRNRFERNPLRLLDCKEAVCQPIAAAAPRISESLCEACAAHF